MADMLVKLYDLPGSHASVEKLVSQGITVRRAMAYEKPGVVAWVKETFTEGWSGECDVSFANQPIACFIAVKEDAIVGFACYDSTCKNFFGPTGVMECHRGQGIGKGLLLTCLHAMAADGYGYAIIGSAGPGDFYAKTVGAVPIEGSAPGIYPDALASD
jgi:ribosomal protein S18 acetylase RimI-like enzyme